MGVTKTIRTLLKPVHEVFITEMGARQTGDIAELCRLVQPKYGFLTSIGEQHLETFKTLDNIIRTKFELIEALPAAGVAFLNSDDANVRAYNVKNPVRKVWYGIDAAGSV